MANSDYLLPVLARAHTLPTMVHLLVKLSNRDCPRAIRSLDHRLALRFDTKNHGVRSQISKTASQYSAMPAVELMHVLAPGAYLTLENGATR